MYTGLIHLHNLLRYVILILLILAIVKSFMGWMSKKEYTAGDNKLSLFLFASAHLQLLIGLILYFISPIVKLALSDMGAAMKEASLRFWAIEHIFSMVLAVVLISLGRIMAKKASDDTIKFRRQAIFFSLAMLLIFYAIPWPWSAVPRPWFPGM